MVASILSALPSLPWDEILLAGRALFLVFSFLIAAIAFTRWRRAAECDTEHTAQQTERVLERLAVLEKALAATDARIAAQAQQLESQFNATPSGSAAGYSYQIAARLARAGASRDELMSGCGLTQQEADLVARLHGIPRRALRSHPAAA
jgi:hypothetical protein